MVEFVNRMMNWKQILYFQLSKKNGLSKIHPAVCPTIKPPSTWLPLSLQKTPGSMVVFYGVALQPGFGFGCRCFLTSSVQEKKAPELEFF